MSGWDVNFQLTQFIGSEAETSIGVFKWAEEAAILVFSPWKCAVKPIQLYQNTCILPGPSYCLTACAHLLCRLVNSQKRSNYRAKSIVGGIYLLVKWERPLALGSS